jgi:puromycin-sensitive aminopeptidase
MSAPRTAKPHRLPEHVRPTAYRLRIRAVPGQARFQGQAEVDLVLGQEAQAIELHARDMAFTKVEVEQGGARRKGEAALHPETESATLRFPSALAKGKATLHLAWEAPVSPSLVGLYLSKDGPEECLVTQFEATDARQCFPCFDEPSFKATLQWDVTTAPEFTVLANGPLQGKATNADGWVTWRFEATPPLSSYLAAFAIGRFGSTPEARAKGTPHKVWAMHGKEGLGVEARDAAVRIQPWFEDYFGVPYRFGKYDQLAVPSFSFGAMENAGLVVFRASRLLMDKRTASWKDLRDITLVVSHEFAHQWFGNHVTMAWWDDLWLNESFAEWIAHACVDALWPQHEVWLDFQGRTNRALATDALGATHPVYQPVATPAEAAEMFDAITYGKGSAVLRMLEAFLGKEAFRKGLRTYMQEFGGANAKGADLWRHLGQASERPVERLMQTWVGQPGHPVVRLSMEGSTLRVKQQRFRSGPGASPGEQRWDVPLVVRYEDDAGVHEARHLLSQREEGVFLKAQGKVKWLLGNAGDLGFYRSDPDDALLQGLIHHGAKLTPAERVGVLRDQWGMVRNGSRPPQRFLALLAAWVPGEKHYAVVETAADIAREMERLLEVHGDASALQAHRAWTARTFAPVLAHAGPDAAPGEAPSMGLLRAAAYRAVAGVGRETQAMAQVVALADRERKAAASVDANLAGTVVYLAAQQGDARRFEAHVEAYKARRDSHAPPQESDRYLGSFTGFRDPALVQRALALLEDGTIPKQSVGPVLTVLLREPHGQAKAWPFVRAHWVQLRKDLGDSWAANIAESIGFLPPPLRAEGEAHLDAHAKDFAQTTARAKDILAERAAVFQRVAPTLAEAVRKA